MTIFESNLDMHQGNLRLSPTSDPNEPDTYDMTFLTQDMFMQTNEGHHFGDIGKMFVIPERNSRREIMQVLIPNTDRQLLEVWVGRRRVEMITTIHKFNGGMGNVISSESNNIILPQWMIYSSKQAIRRMR